MGIVCGTAATTRSDMPNCPKCAKPVYFAERKTSLGRDWHGACLRCDKCNKTLYLASIRSTMINLTATIPAIRLSSDPEVSDAVEPRVMSTNRKREIFVTCPLVSASPALEMQSAAVAARFYIEIMLEKCVSFSMKAPAALTVNKSLSRV